MFFLDKDLTRMSYSTKWARAFAALPDAEVHRVFTHAVETKDEHKLYAVLNRPNIWTAKDLAAIHAAGFPESFLLMAFPLEKDAFLPATLVNSLVGNNYERLIARLVRHIVPTREQTIALLNRDNLTLLNAWLKHETPDAFWHHVSRSGQVRAARLFYGLMPQPVTNLEILNLGNNQQWEMVEFLIERIKETDMAILAMLVKFNKLTMLYAAWRKAPVQCKIDVVKWIWYGDKQDQLKHRDAILQIPVRDIPLQRGIVHHAASLPDLRYIKHFESQGWAVINYHEPGTLPEKKRRKRKKH